MISIVLFLVLPALSKHVITRQEQQVSCSNLPTAIRNKTIYFHHIPKSGGSTICATAKANGENAPPKNCRWHSVASIGSAPPTTTTQCNFIATTNFTFVANEEYMPVELQQDLFFSFILLRNPIDRIVSHYLHASQCMFTVCAVETPSESAACFECMQGLGEWYMARTSLHNFVTRRLLGGIHDDTVLNRTHLHTAKERLRDLFDLVLILEEFEDSGRQLLAYYLDWRIFLRDGTHRNSNAKQELSEDTQILLMSVNKYDMEVYAYARSLSHVLMKQLPRKISLPPIIASDRLNKLKQRLAKVKKSV
eukprot:m.344095 g.344095  ORF g.344095 m.344095 type:complete len:307 (-) comp23833_c0_seq1:230-1150(-)